MRTITKEELKTILENHLHWLKEGCDGWQEMRANLRNADLRNANLSCADLSNADLRNADLRYADMRNANLRNADLRYAYLSYADLSYTYLSNANLSYADLRNANLSNADLSCADLSYADLRYTYLRNADMRYADLSNANLSYANLSYADLSYANLRYADLRNADMRNANLRNADLRCAYHLDKATGLYLPTTCPSDGAFTAWKKCRDGVIAKLLIPETAKRSSATGRKCRASEAVVIALYDKDGNEMQEASSRSEDDFIYRVGETVRPTRSFDENRWEECAPGIHFFVTREEAERY